jgi:hypothetical protein
MDEPSPPRRGSLADRAYPAYGLALVLFAGLLWFAGYEPDRAPAGSGTGLPGSPSEPDATPPDSLARGSVAAVDRLRALATGPRYDPAALTSRDEASEGLALLARRLDARSFPAPPPAAATAPDPTAAFLEPVVLQQLRFATPDGLPALPERRTLHLDVATGDWSRRFALTGFPARGLLPEGPIDALTVGASLRTPGSWFSGERFEPWSEVRTVAAAPLRDTPPLRVELAGLRPLTEGDDPGSLVVSLQLVRERVAPDRTRTVLRWDDEGFVRLEAVLPEEDRRVRMHAVPAKGTFTQAILWRDGGDPVRGTARAAIQRMDDGSAIGVTHPRLPIQVAAVDRFRSLGLVLATTADGAPRRFVALVTSGEEDAVRALYLAFVTGELPAWTVDGVPLSAEQLGSVARWLRRSLALPDGDPQLAAALPDDVGEGTRRALIGPWEPR